VVAVVVNMSQAVVVLEELVVRTITAALEDYLVFPHKLQVVAVAVVQQLSVVLEFQAQVELAVQHRLHSHHGQVQHQLE
jgi:hypothetical protein